MIVRCLLQQLIDQTKYGDLTALGNGKWFQPTLSARKTGFFTGEV